MGQRRHQQQKRSSYAWLGTHVLGYEEKPGQRGRRATFMANW